jgi:tetratricopeptide (TPR) repeat protein
LAILISVLILGGAWYLVARAPATANVLFSWLIPSNTRSVEEAWNTAEGLRSDSNQSLSAIVAGYSRVLEIDPEHVGAQAGLLGAVEAWKSDIREALDAGDLALAEVKLNESFNLDSSDADLAVLFEDLVDRRLAESLLEDARALLQRQGRDDVASSASAIQAYQEVVRLDPTNAEAPAELDRFAQYYADLASQNALAGDVTNAMANMGRASTANPEFVGLDSVREQIQQAATLQAEIDGLLREASRLRALGSLIDPPGSNAAERYQRVLATDPENAIATQGMSEIIAQVQRRFYDLLSLRGFVDIDRLIDRAIAVGLGEASVAEFKSRYALERERVDRVETLIAGAEQLIGQGFITEPADNNAVATLREALRLDPGNHDAEQRLIEAAERLALVAHDAHEVGLQAEARLYLELALTVRPDVGEWRQLRDRWVNDIEPDD